MKETRELAKGRPYARARRMGGGTLVCFESYRTLAECEEAIRNIPKDRPLQFVVYLPHLEEQGVL